jgi:hypothetical protein
MTFAARTFQGMAQGGPIPFSMGLSNNSAATGVRSAFFSLNSDGTTTQTPAGGGTNITGPAWYSPAPTTGAATGLYCKLTINSSSGTTITGTATGSVVSLGGSSWTFTSVNNVTEGTGNGTLYIYGDSGGTNPLATGSVSWDVGYTP